MKKKSIQQIKSTLIVLVLLSLSIVGQAQIVNIPDANFKAALVGNAAINTNFDAEIQVSEANVYGGFLNVNSLGISDLTGIEEFINIDNLNCSDNQLTSLDLSGNANLQILYCNDNNISNLNVTANNLLQTLVCSNNQLSGIDLSANPLLTHFDCNTNIISNIVLSDCPSLQNLDISTNQLSSLDLSLNFSLQILNCAGNSISSLDLSTNIQLTELRFENNLLSNFDATPLSLLSKLYCWSNNLTTINTFGLTSLLELRCDNNSLTNIDVSTNTALTGLVCFNNNFSTLDVTNNTLLTQLVFDGNPISSIDISNNLAIIEFSSSYTSISTLDLSSHTSISQLNCSNMALLNHLNIKNGNNVNLINFNASNNPNLGCISVDNVGFMDANWSGAINGITTYNLDCDAFVNIPDVIFKNALLANSLINPNLDGEITFGEAASYTGGISVNYLGVSDLTGIEAFLNITFINCSNNALTNLDLSFNSKLQNVDCSFNNIVTFLTPLTNVLSDLNCSNNQIASIFLGDVSGLVNFDCSYNSNLTSIDLSQNSSLQTLDVSYCDLSSLDLSFNSNLTVLKCGTNSISALNLNPTPLINYIDFSNNAISTIDLSSIPVVSYVDASSNPIPTIDVSANNNITDFSINYTFIPTIPAFNNPGILNSLGCAGLGLSSVNISIYPLLSKLNCASNNLSSIDFATNPDLGYLICNNNNISSLDFSGNLSLYNLNCSNNALIFLSVKNGTFATYDNFNATNNPLLTCIEVDDVSYFNTTWGSAKDAGANYNTNCSACFVNIPDAIFKNALVTNDLIDIDFDNEISCAEAAAYNGTINVSVLGISDLTGIEAFTALTSLYCNSNSLTSLDVSANTALTVLYCDNNSLASLDVSTNTALTTLYCHSNSLTSLDVSTNTALNILYCYNNSLTSIDLSTNTALTILYCFLNPLTSLDVSNNTALTILNCYSNSLTSIDVSSNTALTELVCNDNSLTSIDLSSNTALTQLICQNNNLTSIDVTTNTALTTLNCYNNSLTSIDVSTNTALGTLSCDFNSLTILDVSTNTALFALYCGNNSLTSLNIQNGSNASLVLFDATNNPSLTCIQVDDPFIMNTNWSAAKDAGATYSTVCPLPCVVNIPDANFKTALLANLSINTNADTDIQCAEASAFNGAINVSGLGIADLTGIEAFVNITNLDCSFNTLGNLDVSFNTALTTLNCLGNNLLSLDVSNNTTLEYLYCSNNALSSLNVTANAALKELYCDNNQISSLNVSANVLLERLWCYVNQLSNLDVSANSALNFLRCEDNQLSSLDVSSNAALEILSCQFNQLSSIEVSSNSALITLECYNNQLVSLNIQNGNNINLTTFNATSNPALTCIQVDDATYMNTNWSAAKDAGATYSTNCACVVNIPDANFKAALVSDLSINTNADAEIQCYEASAYTGAIYIPSLGISDLTGIEAFTSIAILNCDNNALTSLDLSSNTSLTSVSCLSNQLTSLNIDNCASLTQVFCNLNQITSLNTSTNTSLYELYCQFNQISTLDLSNNTNLGILFCLGNGMSNLDVSNNAVLNTLNFGTNFISSIDLSSNPLLATFSCQDNLLTSLDLSNNAALTSINCFNNPSLNNLNIQNGNNNNLSVFNATSNPSLTCIQVDDATYMNTNWSAGKDAGATYSNICPLPCTVNIPDANFKTALLGDLAINTNANTEIECAEASAYSGAINVSNLSISDLTGIEAFTSLNSLDCSLNNLSSINLNSNTLLVNLNVNANTLTSIDISNNTLLQTLLCGNNLITSIDVSANTQLNDFRFFSNQISSIDLSNNTALTYLACGNNQLTSLNLSANTLLGQLGCNINQLTNLDISSNPLLTTFDCSNNLLTAIDVSSCANLNTFFCSSNQFTQLDVSNNSILQFFECQNNNLNSLNIQNGFNTNLGNFNATNNPLLTCIQVDDATFMNTNWSAAKDAGATYNTTCACVVNIPDANFKAALVADLSINTNADTEIQCAEASAYTGTINVDFLGITDLTGIEAFVNITTLYCSNNNLTSIDITTNTQLTAFACEVNQLTSIDVSANTLLTYLDVTNNQLTSIDLTNNSQLVNFLCTFNSITTLDFSSCPMLEIVIAGANPVTSVDLTNNPVLKNLTVGGSLTSLDLSNLPLLEELSSGGSPLLTYIDFSNNPNITKIECASNGLTSLDISANPNVNRLEVQNNNFSSLNMQNGNNINFTSLNLTNNPLLSCIQVDDATFMNTNWSAAKDAGATYSVVCPLPCVVNIPDANFKAALVADLTINTNADADIQCSEAAAYIGTINVAGLSINDLTGIEAFTALQGLNCSLNNLSSINLSANIALTTLNVSGNTLNTIDVSTNTLLQTLQCHNINISSLDVTNNTALTILDCSLNQLSSVDLSNNTLLITLLCGQNPLALLDVSNNLALENLYCEISELTSLDISLNTALKNLNCSESFILNLNLSNNSLLETIDCAVNQLTNLDVSNNTNLTSLSASFNNLTGIDVSNNTALQSISIINNNITSLDISSNTLVTSLSCSNNSLNSLNVKNTNNSNFVVFDAVNNPALTCIEVDDATFMNTNWSSAKDAGATYNTSCACVVNIPDANFKTALIGNAAINTNLDTEIQCTEATAFVGQIDVSNLGIADLTGIEAFTSLLDLRCQGNALTTLDISANTALTFLQCGYNDLTSLDVSSNTLLNYLQCDSNLISSLDLSNNSQLLDLRCNLNQLTSLDLSNNPLIVTLLCAQNNITSINVSNCTNLDVFDCALNQLTTLNVTSNTALTYLKANFNQLTGIDVSANVILENLDISDNQFTNIDISDIPTLQLFYCFGNQLSTIDASNHLALYDLNCHNNLITTLNISNTPSLQYVNCFTNQLTSIDVSTNNSLIFIDCHNNSLSTLNIQNGNNVNITGFNATTNPALSCIQVDDATYMNTNWSGGKDAGATYSVVCPLCVVNIPDANFKAALVGNPTINSNLDAEIQCTEASAYTGQIIVDGLGINDLTGIEAFTNIFDLSCSNNNLTSFDISANTALTSVSCNANNLISIDVSNNVNLTTLFIDQNNISNIDLSNNLLLQRIRISQNSLNNLNTSANTQLIEIGCENNNLVSIDVSNNPLLVNFNCSSNNINAIDLSSNNQLIIIKVANNLLSSLNIQNGNNTNLTTFDATNNASLTCIQVDDATFMSSNWNAAKDAIAGYSTNCACTVTIPDNNFRAALLADAAINTDADGVISCSEAIAYNGVINVSFMSINDLTGIEAFVNITELNCQGNALTSINISANTALVNLYCNSNALTSLNISSNINLVELVCRNNQLTTIDISSNTLLNVFYCDNNLLSSLNLLNNINLEQLDFNSNSISTIDLSSNSLLLGLICSNNLLSSLDLSNNLLLTDLQAGGNAFTAINLNSNTALQTIDLQNSQLINLNLASNNALYIINCQNSTLQNLNIQNGNNSSLTIFNATGNPSLTCIQVDDATFMNTNWATGKDAGASYSASCGLIADFIADVTVICEGAPVTFTNQSIGTTGSTTYSWDFGAGASPASATGAGPHLVFYSTAGTANVSLTVTDGISNTLTQNNFITINSPLTPSINITIDVPSPCPGTAINLSSSITNPTPGYSVTWYRDGSIMGTGDNLSTTVINSSESYTAEYQTFDFCNSPQAAFSNTINAAAQGLVGNPGISSSGPACIGSPISFSGSYIIIFGPVTPISYEWKVNGIIQATTTSPFVSSTLNDGDLIEGSMNYDNGCGIVNFNFGSINAMVYPSIASITNNTVDATCGASNGSYDVTGVTGGTAPYTYSTDGITYVATTLFSGLSAGAYTIYVKDNNNCVYNEPFNINNLGGVTSITNNTVDATCGASNGSYDVTGVTGGTAPYTYSTDGITYVATTLFSGLSAGAYTIYVKDNNNCVYNEPFNINNLGGVTSITNNTVDATCGASNGSYDVTGVTGGTAPYTYSIDNITYVATTLFSGLSAGAYTIYVKDNNNCVYNEPFNINNLGGVTSITNNTVDATCGTSNGSYDVTGVTGGTAPYTYSTDGITYVATTLFSGLSVGAYTIFVQDANNCVYNEPFNINNLGAVTSITNNTVDATCGASNGSYDVTGVTGGTAPYTYSTDGITYVATTLFSGLSAGAYTIFVQDANNCVYNEPFNINNLGGVTSITNNTVDATCGASNGSYDVTGVTGGTAPYTYSTDGITYVATTLFSGLSAGAYTIFVQDANNCVYNEPFNINNLGGVTSITNNTVDATCGASNGSYDVTGVTGGTAPYTYSTDGITYVATTLFSGLSAGAYTIYVKDNNNCVYNEPFNINNLGGVTSITNNTVDATCGASNGSYDVTGVTGGTAPYTYSTDGITYVATTLFSGLSAGAYTIFVQDANNCVYNEPFNINNLGGVNSITNNTVDATCGASNGSYDVTGVTGGTAPYTYSTDGITYVATTLFSGLSAGAYTIYVKDNNNCVYNEPFNINNLGGVTSITNNTVDATCGASNGSYDVTGVTGGTAPYTYSTDGITYVATTLFSGLSAGAYTIFVQDANNCVYNEPFNINNLGGVNSITNNTVDATCGASNGSYDVTGVTGGTAPYTYSTDGITYVATTLFSGLSAGAYTIYVKDNNNCVYNEPFNINNLGGVTSITNNTVDATCGASNGSYDVTGVTGGTAPYTYSTDGITYVATTLFSGLSAGAYTIFVQDANNCVYNEPFNINNLGGVNSITNNTVDATCGASNGSYDVTGVTGGTAPYTYSTDGITYVATTLFSGLSAGAYTIFVQDANNCVYNEPFNINNLGGVTSITNNTVDATCGASNGSYDVTGVTGGTAPYTYSTDGITYVATTLFNGLSAGAYTIFVQDANNCVYNEPFNINNLGGVTSITNNTVDATCGASNGSYDVTAVTGGTAPYTYSIDNITYVATTLFSGLSAGAYTIYVQDANNCVYNEPFNINNLGGVSSITNNTVDATCGASNGSYDVTGVTGGTAPYTFSTDGITYVATTLFSGLSAGAYTIFVQDANNCVYNEPFNINNLGAVTSITNNTVDATCGASNGSYDVTGVTGGTAPYTYSIDNITYVGTTLFSGLSAGAYTIYVKDNNNCVYNEPFNINNLGGVTSITNNTVDATCGASNGSYDVTGVTGGTAPYTYSTDGITYVATTLFNSLSAGAYTIFVQDANNCVYNEPFNINNLGGVTSITNNTVDATCGASNGSYDVTGVTGGTAPYTYSTDGITYVATTLFSGLSAGAYTIFVQDANNCVYNEPFNINNLGGVTSITNNTVDATCGASNGSYDVTGVTGGTAPYTFSTDGITYVATTLFNSLSAGAYTIFVQDANNCVYNEPFNINNLGGVTSITNNTVDATCGASNGSYDVTGVTGGTAPYTYSTDGITYVATTLFSGLSAGAYTIFVQDANNCVYNEPFNINNLGGVTSITNNTVDATCGASNGSYDVTGVTGGTAPYTYSTDGITYVATTLFNSLSAGAYTIFVQDANNCVYNEPFNINNLGGVTSITNNTVDATCGASNGSYDVTGVTGGTAPYTYSTDGITYVATTLFSGLSAGAYTIFVQDANNCVYNEPFNINNLGGVTSITNNTVDATCGASNGSYDVTGVTGGTAPYTFSTDGITYVATTLFNSLSAGAYTIFVQDANNCVYNEPFNINNLGGVTSITNNTVDATCGASNGSYDVTGVTGGTAPYTYSTDGITYVATTLFSGLSAGAYTIFVQDANNCVYNEPFNINNLGGVTSITNNTVDATCGASNGSYDVTGVTGGVAPFTYSIDGITYVSTTLFSNLSASTYTIFVQDANNCIYSEPFTINTTTIPITSAITGNVNPICNEAGVAYNVTLTPGSSYAWSVTSGSVITTGSTGPDNNSILVDLGSTNGNIDVIETNASGCVGAPQTIAISLQGCGLAANFSVDTDTICEGASVTFTDLSTGTTGGTTYAWDFGAGAVPSTATGPGPHLITYVATGSFDVSLTVTDGAVSTLNNPNFITVNPVLSPSVTISVANNTICGPTVLDFTSSVVNGGANPTFQWQLNGVDINNANGDTLNINTLVETDVISLNVISNETCLSVPNASSNQITIIDSCDAIITTLPLSSNSFCAGSNLIVNYNVNGTVNPNNVFIAQLSDGIGSFASPVNIGQITSVSSGSIAAIIPENTNTGAQYRIRVVSNSPGISGTDNGSDITINTINFGVNFSIANLNLSSLPMEAQFVNNTPNLGQFNFTWYFGDGAQTVFNQANLSYQYNQNGSYDVSLMATDNTTGCSQTFYDTLNTILCSGLTSNPCNHNASINAPNVISGCAGSQVNLSVNNFNPLFSYQWHKNGATVNGGNYQTLTVNTNGFYSVTVFDTTGCPKTSNPVQVTFNLPSVTPPVISISGQVGNCGTVNATLTANGNFGSYLWNTGASTDSINISQAGVYSVIGQGTLGCDAQSQPFSVSSSFLPTPAICMVTVDTTTNHHLLMWEKPVSQQIQSFAIYKEIPFNSNNYQQIALLPYDSLSEYIDVNSNAEIQTDRYRLSFIDTCNGETAFSDFVRAIGLKVLPALGIQRCLSWNSYFGAAQNITSYILYSGPDYNNLSVLAVVPPNSPPYTDTVPVAGSNTVYRIHTELSQSCESTRAVRTRSISNGNGNIIVTYPQSLEKLNALKYQFNILPNPNNGSFVINWNNNQVAPGAKMWIESIYGNRVTPIEILTENNKTVSINVESGVYFIKVKSNDNEWVTRFIVVN